MTIIPQNFAVGVFQMPMARRILKSLEAAKFRGVRDASRIPPVSVSHVLRDPGWTYLIFQELFVLLLLFASLFSQQVGTWYPIKLTKDTSSNVTTYPQYGQSLTISPSLRLAQLTLSLSLNYQHYWTRQLCGYRFHPMVPVDSTNIRIADIGTGTG